LSVYNAERRTFYLEPHSGVQAEAAEWINAINTVGKGTKKTTSEATMTTF
jgi:hypothetical protein